MDGSAFFCMQEDYEEFAGHARLMTSIHAQARRPGPLTASGGNTSANNSTVGAHSKGKGESGKQNLSGADGSGLPAQKKAKSEGCSGMQGGPGKPAAAASKVKKSLKRL